MEIVKATINFIALFLKWLALFTQIAAMFAILGFLFMLVYFFCESNPGAYWIFGGLIGLPVLFAIITTIIHPNEVE
jgi:hypothetical protein